MENQQLRENLAAELQRQGLPQAYIQRLLEELDDHFADLQDERKTDMTTARKPESTTADSQPAQVLNLHQRLGDPEQLAAFAANQYRRRSFLGRHPIFTFLIAPLPILVACWTTILLALFAIGWLLELFIEPSTASQREYPYVTCAVLLLWSFGWMVLAPLATAAFLCRIARRNAIDWRWSIAAMVILSLVCSVFLAWGTFPTNDHYIPDSGGNGMLTIGFGISSSLQGIAVICGKFALALGIGLLLVRRAQQLQQRDDHRHSETTLLRRAA